LLRGAALEELHERLQKPPSDFQLEEPETVGGPQHRGVLYFSIPGKDGFVAECHD
jgi:hypothetical protein